MNDTIAKEVSMALTQMHKQITQEYSSRLNTFQSEIERLRGELDRKSNELEKATAAMRQLTIAKKDDLAIVEKMNQLAEVQTKKLQELVPVIVDKATNNAVSAVMKTVNRELTPKVNQALEMLQYTTADDAGMVDDYRRAVMANNPTTGGEKMYGNFTLAWD